jgi:hypothetical protein
VFFSPADVATFTAAALKAVISDLVRRSSPLLSNWVTTASWPLATTEFKAVISDLVRRRSTPLNNRVTTASWAFAAAAFKAVISDLVGRSSPLLSSWVTPASWAFAAAVSFRLSSPPNDLSCLNDEGEDK